MDEKKYFSINVLLERENAKGKFPHKLTNDDLKLFGDSIVPVQISFKRGDECGVAKMQYLAGKGLFADLILLEEKRSSINGKYPCIGYPISEGKVITDGLIVGLSEYPNVDPEIKRIITVQE